MPTVEGKHYPYTKKGRGKARRALLRKQYGKNFRSKFYGDISGYQHGVVKKVNKLRKRLASTPSSELPEKVSRKYDRLYQASQDVQDKRQKFDTKHGIVNRKKGVTRPDEPSRGGVSSGYASSPSGDRATVTMGVKRRRHRKPKR